MEFYNRCRKVRVAVRKCLKNYRKDDNYRRALKGIHCGLTNLVDDMEIRDRIKDIATLNKDFAELRRVLRESQSADEAKQGFSRLKKRFQRKAKRGEKSKNYSRLVRQMKFWDWGLFHCYDDEGIPRTNNDMEFVVKRLRRSWKRTTGMVNIDEFLLYHAPYAIYLMNFRLGYLADLDIQADPYDAVKEVPRDKYQEIMKDVQKRKELDVFRKRANKDIDAALERIVEMSRKIEGS